MCCITDIILRVLLNLTSLLYQLMSKVVDLGGILLSPSPSFVINIPVWALVSSNKGTRLDVVVPNPFHH